MVASLICSLQENLSLEEWNKTCLLLLQALYQALQPHDPTALCTKVGAHQMQLYPAGFLKVRNVQSYTLRAGITPVCCSWNGGVDRVPWTREQTDLQVDCLSVWAFSLSTR